MKRSAALERRFQSVKVEALSKMLILQGLKVKYEDHHNIQLTDEAISAAVELSDRHITGRFLPDKAIDVMDEVGSRARIASMTRPPDVKDLEAEESPFARRRKKRSRIKISKKPPRCGQGKAVKRKSGVHPDSLESLS